MYALLLAAGIFGSPTSFPSLDYDLPIPAVLFEPAVKPAPAVLVLHGCGGVDQTALEWGRWLAENGYIALVADSFTPRRAADACSTHAVTSATRALDAYGALSYLRTRPDVDPAHVGEIGFSDGGDAVLATEAQLHAHPAFEAAIALSPTTCDQQSAASPAFPLLLLCDQQSATDPRARVLAFLKQHL